jgi:hypothetical protein
VGTEEVSHVHFQQIQDPFWHQRDFTEKPYMFSLMLVSNPELELVHAYHVGQLPQTRIRQARGDN